LHFILLSPTFKQEEEEEEIIYGAPSRTSPEDKDGLISLRVAQILQ